MLVRVTTLDKCVGYRDGYEHTFLEPCEDTYVNLADVICVRIYGDMTYVNMRDIGESLKMGREEAMRLMAMCNGEQVAS